ncbi:LOW QUALITY PROTEIN: quaternary ammonium compound-resistance protein SugE [Geomicrobium sp. JCM 19055]|nr:LOW QUALITY PROTEIN: quaternary ammonium compound-resistance protein SugE [Geomicrobium sp. JCM 19055]
MSWMILIIAGLLEVAGVNGIQRYIQGQKVSGILFIVFGFAISLTLLSIAMETIPLGVAYAVWTGMGTVGSAVIGMIFLQLKRCKTNRLLGRHYFCCNRFASRFRITSTPFDLKGVDFFIEEGDDFV